METPSTFHLNFSPIMIGERMAVDIIETHIVDDVNITFPKDNDTKFKSLLSIYNFVRIPKILTSIESKR